jgi:L-lactate utilization protein LutB
MLYIIRLGGIIGDVPAYAGLCKQCGKCERICPQHIPVQQRLKEVSEKFEGRGMGARRFLMKGGMGGALRLQNIVGKIRRMVSGKK